LRVEGFEGFKGFEGFEGFEDESEVSVRGHKEVEKIHTTAPCMNIRCPCDASAGPS
jgi:hypothetical protein